MVKKKDFNWYLKKVRRIHNVNLCLHKCVSFIIIPWIQNYVWRADSRQCIHTSRFCLWSKQVELLLSLHATRAHKVFCYSSSKYWLKDYKPKEVQKDKAKDCPSFQKKDS